MNFHLYFRVSFIVNNTILLNLLHLIFPQSKHVNITDENRLDMERVAKMWSAKEFFALAGIPKEDVILGSYLTKKMFVSVFENSILDVVFQTENPVAAKILKLL